MALIGQSIAEFEFFPDSPPAIIGKLITGQTVFIELWENGAVITPTTSGCNEVGNTGQYSWSTASIPVLTASRQQFHWRMSDGANKDEGDFVLISHEDRDGGMPSLLNQSSYIIKN